MKKRKAKREVIEFVLPSSEGEPVDFALRVAGRVFRFRDVDVKIDLFPARHIGGHVQYQRGLSALNINIVGEIVPPRKSKKVKK